MEPTSNNFPTIPSLTSGNGSQSNSSNFNSNLRYSIPSLSVSISIPTLSPANVIPYSLPITLTPIKLTLEGIAFDPNEVSLNQPPLMIFDEAVRKLHGLTLSKILYGSNSKLKINDVDDEGRFLLHRALAIKVSFYVIHLLLGYGATIHPETWHHVMNGNGTDMKKLEVIELLLEKGAPIDKDFVDPVSNKTTSLIEYIININTNENEPRIGYLKPKCLMLIESRSHS